MFKLKYMFSSDVNLEIVTIGGNRAEIIKASELVNSFLRR